MWEITLQHDGLNKHRVIRGREKRVVEEKARMQQAAWEEQWERKLEVEQRKLERIDRAEEKARAKELATEQTQEAELAHDALEQILANTLDVDDALDWDTLKDTQNFSEKMPNSPSELIAKEPNIDDIEFLPNYSLFDYLVPGLKKRKQDNLNSKYEDAKKKWELRQTQYKISLVEFEKKLRNWEERKNDFKEQQDNINSALEDTKKRYLNKKADSIEEYCDLVLSGSQYPEYFPKEFEIGFNTDSGIIIIDYILPDIDDLPTVKEVKYIQSREEFEEKHLSAAAIRKLYDSVLYQVCLRTVHEMFEADVINSIASVIFNGWVNYIDKSTGKDTSACIMSFQANKDEFLEIDLRHVDPQLCFKALKGVGSSKLHSMAPIAPILTFNRDDSRFIQSIEVANQIDEGTNLAAIGWQEFEHLIREIFEKEFSAGGGEVKITQASRDGGVDAIAFDPDPIRGGKIVIQAKRYTNVAGVAAVRDLYGTVMNEGATKGILVTTSNYGPDAYDFAKGKPITLLNGGNLLHLLAKHGHKARINLQEAKMIARENEF